MYQPIFVQKMHSCTSLYEIVESLSLSHLLFISDYIEKVALLSVFQKEIYNAISLEICVKSDYILMIYSLVNIAFPHESILDLLVSKRVFVYSFHSHQLSSQFLWKFTAGENLAKLNFSIGPFT
jgi:hypothetical protein